MENLYILLQDERILFTLVLILNIFSSCIGTLKTIFVSKQVGNITYLIVFIDALTYSLILKSFSAGGLSAIIAYVAGKVIGNMFADIVERKLAIGIYGITLYIKEKEKMFEIQDILIQNGYSSTANIGILNDEKKRFSLYIELPRKQMKDFMTLLRKHGLDDPTMSVQELKTVYGKIANRIN